MIRKLFFTLCLFVLCPLFYAHCVNFFMMKLKEPMGEREFMHVINEWSDYVTDLGGFVKGKEAMGGERKNEVRSNIRKEKTRNLMKETKRLAWDAFHYLFIIFFTIFFTTYVFLRTSDWYEVRD